MGISYARNLCTFSFSIYTSKSKASCYPTYAYYRSPNRSPYCCVRLALVVSYLLQEKACRFEINLAHANRNPAIIRFLEVLFRVWRPHSPPKVGFVAELDDIGRIQIKEPAFKVLLSSYVWSDISRMSIPSECIQQIRSYQPWATLIEHDIDLLEPTLILDSYNSESNGAL
jgi:hypothetical protein